MHETEAALVERCLSGDESGMRALVERFQKLVFSLCYRMLGQRQDAEDVAQEAFLRAFRSLHRWDSARPFRPWLMTIAANRCRTQLEKRSRRPAPSEFVSELAEAPPPPSDEIGEELQLALEELRDEYRTCFVLFYQNDLSVTEISDAMDRPEGTVKTWLHRARKEMAEILLRRGVVPDARLNVHST